MAYCDICGNYDDEHTDGEPSMMRGRNYKPLLDYHYSATIMNRDYMANMLFNINDVVDTIQGHSITDDIIEEYDESQFEEEPKTLMDIPKDWAKYEDWSDIFPEIDCMCEQCFNAYDRLGKIKWSNEPSKLSPQYRTELK